MIDHDPPAESAVKPRRQLLPPLLLLLLAFIGGLAAMGWLLSKWDRGAVMLGVASPPAAQQAPPPAPKVTVEREPAPEAAEAQEPERLVIDPEITRRVNRLEQKLAELDVQSREAVGNADRAEGLLVAFAARRALDSGVSLGYIEGLLRQRFGQTQPQAVATIITAARQPVTLQELQEGLQQVGPQLVGGGPEQSWWSAFKTELSGIVAIRREGTPSPLPAERLKRATQQLEAGQVVVALAEVLRTPGHDKASDWIGKARRYVAARRALDQIETAALLEPRTPAATGRSPQPARPAAR
jgi:hypothetical protein